MGATSSLPTEGKLDDRQTRELITTIMRQMLSKASIVDLYSLSDPEKCKDYVVVTKDALKRLFSEIKVYPGEGEKGTLYFQRIKGMRLRSDDVEKQDKYCKDLAFFYVRIFQIFAALALTVFDSVPRDVYIKGKVGEAVSGRRPLYMEAAPPGFRRPEGQRGGLALSDREGFTYISGSSYNVPFIQYPNYAGTKWERILNLLGTTDKTGVLSGINYLIFNYYS
jgi:hypothetical protein